VVVAPALALVLAIAGPPKLPPIPGQGEPDAPDPQKPDAPKAAAPAKPAAPVSKLPPKPVTEPAAATPGSPPSFEPAPVPPSGVPEPAPTVTPPPEGAPAADAPAPPRRGGPGAAPSMAPGPSLPGTADAPAPVLRFPPPVRPAFDGTGLLIGAGVAFALALTEQIVAHRLVVKRCIDPLDRQAAISDVETAEDFGHAVAECVPGVLPAIALRVHSDLALVAAIAFAAGGAVMRARRQAFDHVFAGKKRRDIPALRISGISLIATGLVTWFATGAAAWGMLGSCHSAACAKQARRVHFATRDTGVAIAAAGAGMLGFAEGYRRAHDGFTRDRALSVAPVAGFGSYGFAISGRF
jgi:hypothetical protein